MKNKYIKSPLQYTGGKYKLLPQILPLFPNKISTFVDLFGGGFNVGINVNAEHIIYNDISEPVTKLLDYFNQNDYKTIHTKILETIERYGLSRSDVNGYSVYGCNSSDGLSSYNKEQYTKLREDYNNSLDNILFYTIIAYSFSNQIRFNSKGEFNMPCGKRDYNTSLQGKLKAFIEVLHSKDCCFMNASFDEFDFDKFDNGDFVYCDPPYFNSVAAYNEQGGWTEEHEQKLLALLDKLNGKDVRFALSNNLKYDNPFLDEWKNKYKVHYLSGDYSNCNYHKIDRSKDIEVLITNY